MRPHRALVSALKAQITLEGREAHHLVHVLRAREGDRLTVFDGQGGEGTARIVALEGDRVLLELQEQHSEQREVGCEIVLYQALLKGDQLADLVRAATELGVTRVVPLITTHAVVKEMGTAKLERLRRIAIEAAKQCQRGRLPQIDPPIPLSQIPVPAWGVVAHPGSSIRVRDLWPPHPLPAQAALVSGPEGGFSQAEVALLLDKGFTAVTLGRRILRAETAPLALLSLLTAGEGW